MTRRSWGTRAYRKTVAEQVAELWGSEAGSAPVHDAYFIPVGQTGSALHASKGTTVTTPKMLRSRH